MIFCLVLNLDQFPIDDIKYIWKPLPPKIKHHLLVGTKHQMCGIRNNKQKNIVHTKIFKDFTHKDVLFILPDENQTNLNWKQLSLKRCKSSLNFLLHTTTYNELLVFSSNQCFLTISIIPLYSVSTLSSTYRSTTALYIRGVFILKRTVAKSLP